MKRHSCYIIVSYFVLNFILDVLLNHTDRIQTANPVKAGL